MLVKELATEVGFDDVFRYLQKYYKIHKNEYYIYEKVYDQIKDSKLLDMKKTIVLIKKYPEFFDVYGINIDDPKAYDLSYSSFEEWANFHIYFASTKDKPKSLAHVLYEATYNGFSNEEIEKALLETLQ